MRLSLSLHPSEYMAPERFAAWCGELEYWVATEWGLPPEPWDGA